MALSRDQSLTRELRPAALPGFSAALASRCANPVEELLDLSLQPQALARQRLGRGKHLAGGFARFASPLGGVPGVDGDVGGPARSRPHALGDVLRRAALLLDRGRNRVGDAADALDGLA